MSQDEFFDEDTYALAVDGANEGSPDAQVFLACMHLEGRGARQDYAEARKWFTRAAEQGHADAQLYLAQMYEQGRDSAPDLAAAEKWYRRAADQENVDAIRWLLRQGRQESLPPHLRIDGLRGPLPGGLRGTRVGTMGRSFHGLGTRQFRGLLREAGAQVRDVGRSTALAVVGKDVPPVAVVRLMTRLSDGNHPPLVPVTAFLILYGAELAELRVSKDLTFAQYVASVDEI